MPHPLVTDLYGQMSLPVISAPMFIVSNPKLVLAQCTSGVVGSFPALNARPQSLLNDWLDEIQAGLASYREAHPGAKVAPYAVNQIIHQSNDRLEQDLAVCASHRVPLIITSLRAPGDLVKGIHDWGGKVFHDVTTLRHAEKALEAGVDGLILVCAGAGGHAGTLSPFALLSEVRRFYDGPLILSGAITTGEHVLAAQAMGADFAYMGTRFIASEEANASEGYKSAIVDASASDVLYTPFFTGIPGNYLKASVVAAGLDPANLPAPDSGASSFGSGRAKPWKDIWGAGRGVSGIDSVLPTREIVARLRAGMPRPAPAWPARTSRKHGATQRPDPENAAMSAGLNIDRDGAVLTLTINRPERRNALDNATYAALTEQLARASADASVSAVILTGAGEHFTAGNDLRDFQAERGAGDSAAMSFLRALTTTDVPVIAAVEGYAVGIGVTLLQHCDFVHIGEGATLRLPFVALGLCPEGASSLLLPRLAGARRAAEWLLQGKAFGARQALEAGLATTVTPAGQALAAAHGGRSGGPAAGRAAADQGHAQAPGPRGHPGHAGL